MVEIEQFQKDIFSQHSAVLGYSQFTFIFIRKLRALDATKFQVQFCISLLGMLVVYLIGVTRNENEIVCTLMSALLQYFVLSSTLWMVAQGVLMFKKLVLVFGIISKRFLVIVSLLCWCKQCTSSPIKLYYNYSLGSEEVRRGQKVKDNNKHYCVHS